MTWRRGDCPICEERIDPLLDEGEVVTPGPGWLPCHARCWRDEDMADEARTLETLTAAHLMGDALETP